VADLRGFRDRFLGSDPVFTRLVLLDSHLAMLEDARSLSKQKARRLRASIVALSVATTLGFVGVAVQSG
jgi:hypothetical protein